MTSRSLAEWRKDAWRNRAGWLPAAAAAVLIAIALAANAPPLSSPFFLVDDGNYVTENAPLKELPLAEAWKVFVERTNPWEYLPLRDLSYRIDLALFGMRPAGFRTHNLLLYALTCAGVWWFTATLLRLLRRRVETADLWVATVATALFAAHPAHVESVAWISGRKDLLSGAFAVGSLGLFASALRPGRPSVRRLVGSYLLFAGAILSKSTVVTVPAVAWLIALAQPTGPRRWWPDIVRATLLTAPLFLLSAASVGLQVGMGIAYAPNQYDELGDQVLAYRVRLSASILGTLTQIAVLPHRLRLTYDVAPGAPTEALAAAIAVAAALLLLGGLWLAAVRRSAFGLGLAAMVLLMLPFLQIIPFNTWSFASERFLYLPVLGLCVAAAVALGRLPPRPRAATAVVLLVLGLASTTVRSIQWRNGPALIEANALLSPTHPIAARIYIVHFLCTRQKFEEARSAASRVQVRSEQVYLLLYVRAQEARHRGDVARLKTLMPMLISTTPRDDLSLRVEVANMTLAAELYAEAEQAYRDLLRDFAAIPEMRYNLGLTLERQGRHAQAALEMEAAIAGGYKRATVWNNLGLALRDAARHEDAADAFRSALKADSKHWHAAYNLARLLWARGDRAGALLAVRDARARATAAGASSPQLDEVERAIAADRPGAAGTTP
jgi:tetratricopeptide (TPR) repeat protein